MVKDSSFGSAALRSRTINVGANLLGEWLSERDRERRALQRYALMAGAALLVGCFALPPLWRSAAAAGRQEGEFRARVKDLDAQLAVADATKKAAQPGLVVKAMCEGTTGSLDRLLAVTTKVLAAGNARTAINSLKVEVNSGEAHLTVQAEAEEDGAADAFARNAGDADAKVDAIVSSRPSTLLAPQGVGFAYEKRIGVAP